jgi:hypothetical protein
VLSRPLLALENVRCQVRIASTCFPALKQNKWLVVVHDHIIAMNLNCYRIVVLGDHTTRSRMGAASPQSLPMSQGRKTYHRRPKTEC